jgi:hypothetical protein
VPNIFILLGVFGILAGAAGLIINFTGCYIAANSLSGATLSVLLAPSVSDQRFVLLAARFIAAAVLAGMLIVVSRKMINGSQSARAGAIIYGWAGVILAILSGALFLYCGEDLGVRNAFTSLSPFVWRFHTEFSRIHNVLKVVLIETFLPGIMLFMMATQCARRFYGAGGANSRGTISPKAPQARAAQSPARSRRRGVRRAA